ncbi:MAG: methionine--tRNA ligase [Deltaproteobacteria bacterium CG_4_10_14_0_2_um_filter_43_8]|nr:MAG: methionine--tRNA ligase [Deltaproteobacteria bacterium CG_4_10_14_0_2_um_filter_43_8]PJC64958.1 MAG: methionine--tRNA ligase [Deltaproteobacteria bacterium CG_4_9_14_0_2_um_filter_42_21]
MVSEPHYFITAALPYANGPLHFGHLAGVYLPADIYYRHTVLLDRKAVFISGSDEHGVAITLSAEKDGKGYQEYVDEYYNKHQEVFRAYNIEFSYYGRTSSKFHKQIAQEYFLELQKKNVLVAEECEQPFCPNCNKHIPDRYVGGICSNCEYEQARGDECPQCGKWLSFKELKEPFCQICKQTGVSVKKETQWFLDLPKLAPKLKKWLLGRDNWKKGVLNFALSLIESGLPKRAITRNIAWGIDVPGEEETGKKLYVWFEAPIAYFSMLREYFESKKQPSGWKSFWNSDAKIIHFIGKDNIVFHTIVWPAMLLGLESGVLPTNVPANMYVQLKGKQFSKTSKWSLDAMEAISQFGEDSLRFYLTTIIPEQSDSEFSWEGFGSRVNGELVNNLANFCNRILSLVKKNLSNAIEASEFQHLFSQSAIKAVNSRGEKMRFYLDNFEFRKALEEVLCLGNDANKFCNDEEPWKVLKLDSEKGRQILTANLVYLIGLGTLLKPFLPNYASKVCSIFPNINFKEIYGGNFSIETFKYPIQLNLEINLAIPRIPSEVLNEKIDSLSHV